MSNDAMRDLILILLVFAVLLVLGPRGNSSPCPQDARGAEACPQWFDVLDDN